MIECLIDTDTLSYFLKGDKNVTINVEEYLRFSGFDRLTISVITIYEVLAGLEYKQAVKQIEKFITKSKIVQISDESL